VIEDIITKIARRQFAGAVNFREGERPVVEAARSVGDRLLYVHVPFCEILCSYCSFNRVVFEENLCRRYFRALREEMTLYRRMGYDFQGLYVGGGTPTVLVDELEETLGLARGLFAIREISVETNPNHLTDDRLDRLARAGVNRLSVGVQSFDDGLLQAMGRYAKYGSGTWIADRLKRTQGVFDTLNVDMIFNFPGQSESSLRRDIDIVAEHGFDQVTWYPLMVSDSTRRTVTQTLGEVDFHREKVFYEIIRDRLLRDYSFSSAWCFSRRQSMIDEYIVDYPEYAGLGSGSIGYLQGRCYANTFDIEEYIRYIDKGELPLMASRTFGTGDLVFYDFMMGLFGGSLNPALISKRYGLKGLLFLWAAVVPFAAAGGVRFGGGRILSTRRGRYYWVVLMREFFTAVNNFRDYCKNRGEGFARG